MMRRDGEYFQTGRSYRYSDVPSYISFGDWYSENRFVFWTTPLGIPFVPEQVSYQVLYPYPPHLAIAVAISKLG